MAIEIGAIVVLSAIVMGALSWVSGWVDTHAYDEKAQEKRERLIEYWNNNVKAKQIIVELTPDTRYHTRGNWDAWHIMRRIERYGMPLASVASTHLFWQNPEADYVWFGAMLVLWGVAGLIGFNLADKWKGSMWWPK